MDNPDPKPEIDLEKYITTLDAYKLATALAITRGALSWTMADLEPILQAVLRSKIFLENIEQVLRGDRTLDYVEASDEFVFDLASEDIRDLMRVAFSEVQTQMENGEM